MKQSEVKYLAQGHKPVGQDWMPSRRSDCLVGAPNIQVLKSVNNLPLTAAYQDVVNVQLLGTGSPITVLHPCTWLL